MKSWTLKIGSFFGIEVFIHWTFWILMAWILLIQLNTGSGFQRAFFALGFILALFACVVAHEFGHALTARRYGVKTRDITLYPIGGIARLEDMPEKPIQEFLIALAGPAVNAVIAAILYFAVFATGVYESVPSGPAMLDIFETPFLWSLLVANLALAIFNLVPAFPMDGGRALRAVLSVWTNRLRATRIAAAIGQSLAIFFVFIGFYTNIWLIFIGLFVYLGAGFEFASEQTKSELAGFTVEDALMRKFTVLDVGANLGDAAEELLDSQDTEFVIEESGLPVGILTKPSIIRGLAEAGTSARVSDFMNRKFETVKPSMPLTDFLRKVLNAGEEAALVVDSTGVRGLIDRTNVEEKILIQKAIKPT